MRWRWILFACIVCPVTIGCGVDSRDVLESADSITLYSIDGNDYFPPKKKPKTDEEFHSYPVLGKVEVTDASKLRQLVVALKEGIDEHGGGAKCFWPRHGVRVVRGNQWVDYVICFQCGNVYEYTSASGARYKEEGNHRKPLKETLNKYLTDAGVPLASEKIKSDGTEP
jgi:hypothetical protein